MSELICVDADYNEIDCADSHAAFQVTREDAKAKGGKVSKAKPAEEAAPEETEEKAVKSAPENKAKAGASNK